MVGDSLYFVQYLSVHLIKKCRSLSFIQFSFPESDSFDYCPIIMLQIGGGSGGGVGGDGTREFTLRQDHTHSNTHIGTKASFVVN